VVAVPVHRVSVAREAFAPADDVATVVTPAAGTPPLAVRVAVVSVQNGAPARLRRPARRAASVRQAATLAARPTQTTGEGRRRNAGTAPAPAGARGGASANGQLPAPVLRSGNAQSSGPASAGKKGVFSSSTPPNQGQARPGTSGRSAGTAAGAGARATGATKRAQTGGASTGQQGASAGKGGGTSGSGAGGKASQPHCFYGCTRLPPSQITAPGLVTGKGAFAGKGLPGGRTAGHAAGATSTLGSAKKTAASKTARQLTVTSAYRQTNGTQLSTKQVQGHNGTGSTQPSVVQAAGTTGGRTFDYVSPDANMQPAADDAILGRYFTHTPAS